MMNWLLAQFPEQHLYQTPRQSRENLAQLFHPGACALVVLNVLKPQSLVCLAVQTFLAGIHPFGSQLGRRVPEAPDLKI